MGISVVLRSESLEVLDSCVVHDLRRVPILRKGLVSLGGDLLDDGYRDIVMSPSWRMLGAIEDANGALLFGVSTAMIFAVIQDCFRSGIGFSETTESQVASVQVRMTLPVWPPARRRKQSSQTKPLEMSGFAAFNERDTLIEGTGLLKFGKRVVHSDQVPVGTRPHRSPEQSLERCKAVKE